MLKNLSKFFVISLLAFSCKTPYHAVSTKSQSAQIDSTTAVQADATSMIAPYKQQLDGKMNRIIGKTAKNLPKGGMESPLGNLIADLQQIKAKELTGKSIDMGMVADGGLRIPMLSEGNISVGTVYELMPFDNELWVLTLKGETLQKLFKYMGNRKGLSISNTQVTFNGKELEQVLIGGKPLEINRLYTIATSDYLAGGGDGMAFLSEATEIVKTETRLRDVIISYIEDQTKAGKTIDSTVEGRVFVK